MKYNSPGVCIINFLELQLITYRGKLEGLSPSVSYTLCLYLRIILGAHPYSVVSKGAPLWYAQALPLNIRTGVGDRL